jgi:hypothetical protein
VLSPREEEVAALTRGAHQPADRPAVGISSAPPRTTCSTSLRRAPPAAKWLRGG